MLITSISISEMVICLSELRIMQHLICLQMQLLNFQVLGKLHLSQVLRNQTELLTVQSVDVLRAVLSLRAILRDRKRHGNLLNGGLQQRHRQSLDRLFRLHMVVNISGLRQIQKRLHSFL